MEDEADASDEAKPKIQEKLREKLRDASVKFLEDHQDASEAEAEELERVALQILNEHPDHLPVLLWRLQLAGSAWRKVRRLERFPLTQAARESM